MSSQTVNIENPIWRIEPGNSVCIVGVNSYNTSSLLYEIECIEKINFEVSKGFMIIVDNPEEPTTIKFPLLRQIDENDIAYEDTLLIQYHLMNEEH
jgi:hypothetical protein